jgi:hypothetical protein
MPACRCSPCARKARGLRPLTHNVGGTKVTPLTGLRAWRRRWATSAIR